MKVLVNRYNENDVTINEQAPSFKCTCGYCHSELEYEKHDLYFNEDDKGRQGMSIDCPCCGRIILIDPCEPTDFPKSFFQFGVSENSQSITDKEIKEWIIKGLKFLHSNPSEELWLTASGDTRVDIINYSGDKSYNVIVSKNYWETDIDYDYVENILK